MKNSNIGRPKGSSTNLEGMEKLRAASVGSLRLLYEKGLSTREIGAHFGVSKTAVDNRFAALGIARRTQGETNTRNNSRLSVSLSDSQEQLILGSGLGDACIYRQAYGAGRFSHKVAFAQGEDQLSYLEFKREVLLRGREHLPKTCVSKISRRPEGSNLGKPMSQFSFTHTPTMRAFEEKFDIRDSRGKIQVSVAWVSALKAEALAYWFLDDGCLITKETSTANRLALHTNAYDAGELSLLLEVIRRSGLPSARLNLARAGQHIIVNNRIEEIKKFVKIIKPYTPSCMLHKLKNL